MTAEQKTDLAGFLDEHNSKITPHTLRYQPNNRREATHACVSSHANKPPNSHSKAVLIQPHSPHHDYAPQHSRLAEARVRLITAVKAEYQARLCWRRID